MTRRDYCRYCSTLVSDYDVICHKCDLSYCSSCISMLQYTQILNRLLVLSANLNTFIHPKLMVKELHQFNKDICSEEYLQFIKNASNNTKKSLEIFCSEINQMCDKYKNTDLDIYIDESDVYKIGKFIKCLDILSDVLFDCEECT